MDTNTRYEAAEHFGHAVHVNDVAHEDTTARPVAASDRAQRSEIGSGWYHDEAIKNAKEAHAHPYL